jgi:hypothetical protein
MDQLINIFLSVGIVLAFAFNSRREWLGGLPASPRDDGSETLLWFALCVGLWPLMLASAAHTKTRKSLREND